jgi:hypothetical protein
MYTREQRIRYFLLGCFPARLVLAFLAYILPITFLPILGMFVGIIALGFFYNYLFSRSTVGFFGGKVWWEHLRLVHSLILGLFSYLALTDNSKGYIVLVIDAFIGLVSFLAKYNIF